MNKDMRLRALPPVWKEGTAWPARREELLECLRKNLYGYSPKAPDRVEGTIVWQETGAYGEKADHYRIKLRFEAPNGEFSFPFHLVVPRHIDKPPVLLHIAVAPSLAAMPEGRYPNLEHMYSPVEEILDQGFALTMFCYQDIIPDTLDGEYQKGMGAAYEREHERGPSEWGKIGMWAFAASRVIDYLVTLPFLDADCISVIGHSRLGKTALWCGAQDERVFCTISNNSGFGGAALAKLGTGEKVSDFIRFGSCDWFCKTFTTFLGKENELPYDQHYLLACLAPRYVCVGSAVQDYGADPVSEYLACLAAGEAFERCGVKGVAEEDPSGLPGPGCSLQEGHIGYHLREGDHFLSRYDWLQYIRYIKRHRR